MAAEKENVSQMPTRALFKPFCWHSDPDPFESRNSDILESTAKDLSYGIETVLELIERSDILGESGCTPIIDNFHRGVLLRLAITSARMLGEQADAAIEVRNTDYYRQKAAKATRGKPTV